MSSPSFQQKQQRRISRVREETQAPHNWRPRAQCGTGCFTLPTPKKDVPWSSQRGSSTVVDIGKLPRGSGPAAHPSLSQGLAAMMHFRERKSERAILRPEDFDG